VSGWSAANCPHFVAIPPQERKAFHKAVLAEILEERVVSIRGPQIPRGVKGKMGNFPLRPHKALAKSGDSSLIEKNAFTRV
jgi:hypothetical protein